MNTIAFDNLPSYSTCEHVSWEKDREKDELVSSIIRNFDVVICKVWENLLNIHESRVF